MPNLICAFAADCHLEPYAWARHPTLTEDSYHSFAQIIDFCYGERVDLILAGDVFNKNTPDSRSVRFALEQLERLGYIGRKCIYIQGQHEKADPPWLRLSKNTLHAHGIRFVPHGKHDLGPIMYGLDFTRSDNLKEELARIESDVRVLIAHQVWDEFMGKIRLAEGALKDVPHVSTIVTGDFHAHKTLNVKRNDGSTIRVLSPGSTCMQTTDEDPSKFFFAFFDDGSVKSIPIMTRKVYRHGIYSTNDLTMVLREMYKLDLEPFTQGLPKALKKPMLIVKYSPEVPDVSKELARVLGEKYHIFDSPADTKTSEVEEEYQESCDTVTFEEYLARKYNRRSAVYATSARLWRSGDVKAEVEAIIQEGIASSKPGGVLS